MSMNEDFISVSVGENADISVCAGGGEAVPISTAEENTADVEVEEIMIVGGTSDHRDLSHRGEPDQHPISSITGLSEELFTPMTNAEIFNIVKGINLS